MMNIDDLTIGQAKQLAAMFAAQVASESAPELDAHLIGTPVIIRTYSAGVHFGIHDGRKGPEIRLKDARRRTCSDKAVNQWKEKNRDRYNEYQRAYRARRKEEGNPVASGS
jgi:hypothetical protein